MNGRAGWIALCTGIGALAVASALKQPPSRPPEAPRSGVVTHVEGRTQPGLNFYTSRKQAQAQLIDMNGTVVHQWSRPEKGGWQHATLLPDGDVLALVKDKKLIKVDKHSNVLWTYRGRVHHDLDVGPDGHIFVLARTSAMRPRFHDTYPTVEDWVVELDTSGHELNRTSILGLLERSSYAFLLNDGDGLTARTVSRANPRRSRREFDILHSNHVEVFDGSLEDRNPLFAKGNLLLSPRNTHTILVANPKTQEVLWVWGGSKLVFPHHPTVTKDGTVLVFNNGTEATGSQVIELDPVSGDIVWTYGPVDGFFSKMRGSNLRLDNGNTLITESDSGTVFEVSPAKEVVWEFRNPHMRKKKRRRMAIWRMFRVDPATLSFDYGL